jgi:peptide deformylase
LAGPVVIAATEMLSRVMQHEIDHLDGIEYVQRVNPPVQQVVYDRMRSAGIDTSLFPSFSSDTRG